jgi:predicted dehydrogenase
VGASEAELKVGVIGLGVGEQHVLSYQRHGAEVAVVCDFDEAKLADVAGRYDVERRETDWRRVTDDPALDAVSVCTFDDSHADICVAALNAGKHVMVEKPVALTRAEAERILRAVEDSGKLLTSNLILRRSPRFRAVKDLVDAGELGELFYLEGDYLHEILWKLTAGWRGQMDTYCVTYGGGIHLIDLMRWILDDEVTEVSAMGADLLVRGSRYTREDLVVALLRFSRGAIAKNTTTLGPQRPKFHALNLYGTEATFVNDVPHGRLYKGTDPADETPITAPYPGVAKGDLLPGFIAAVRDGSEPEVSTRDVFRVMDICFAVQEALESGKTVPVSYLL